MQGLGFAVGVSTGGGLHHCVAIWYVAVSTFATNKTRLSVGLNVQAAWRVVTV
jgi:hypothetical protein